mgnify:FL=1
MAGFEYGNARLRAMKSRLLARGDYQALAGSGTLERLLTALTRTPYQEAVEATLVRGGELVAISAAFSHDLLATVRRIRGFFEEPECQAVAIALRMYDVHNVKAILRGLDNKVPPNEIRSAQLPAGDLSEDVLAELAQAPDPRAAVDLMASLRIPLARPLVRARAGHPSAEIPELELALDRWYFEGAFAELGDGLPGAACLKDALALEADLINLLTVLRLAYTPSDTPLLLERFHAGDLRDLWVGPGRLSFDVLAHAASQPSLEGAVKSLEDTPYGAVLASGLDAYRRSHLLSDLERRLLRHRLHWRAGLIRQDPLGIGVLLGYLALKINEIGNLRWVAHGINNGLPADRLMEGLELVDE